MNRIRFYLTEVFPRGYKESIMIRIKSIKLYETDELFSNKLS